LQKGEGEGEEEGEGEAPRRVIPWNRQAPDKNLDRSEIPSRDSGRKLVGRGEKLLGPLCRGRSLVVVGSAE
jgi:hypothetical protein